MGSDNVLVLGATYVACERRATSLLGLLCQAILGP